MNLYTSGENVFVSGSVRFKLDRDAKFLGYAFNENPYREYFGFEAEIFDEGSGVYRADLRGGYARLSKETFGLPDIMPFQFYVYTDKGYDFTSFWVQTYEDAWDARRVNIKGFDREEVTEGERIVIEKPEKDGKLVRTGSVNKKVTGHAHHHPDPYFGSGWVNDFEYSIETLKLVDETADAFILEAIAPGDAWTICTVREIDSNASLSVQNAWFMVRPLVPSAADISFDSMMADVRFSLQEGFFESGQQIILVQDAGSYSQTLNADFEYEAYLADTDVVTSVEVLEARPSASRPAMVFRYKLDDVKAAGETQLIIRVTYKGASYNCVIPVVVYDEEMELAPTTDALVMEETWSNFYFNLAYCNELLTPLELEMGSYYRCHTCGNDKRAKYDYELLTLDLKPLDETAQKDWPYAISFLERSEGESRVVVSMKPNRDNLIDGKMKTGRYSYVVRYTVTCCGETRHIDQRVPVLVVDIPENKEDYLHTPPKYMCLDRDSIYWDREILTPINRYCDLELSFTGEGLETWNESYFDRYLVYKPEKAGLTTWEYIGHYANGDMPLYSGEIMIFPAEAYEEVGGSQLTSVRDFDLTPAQRYVPRLFAADENWNKNWFLKSEVIHTGEKDSICYELSLVDEYENEVQLPEATTLYLPYPEGMTAEEAAEHEFVIVHEAKDGTQVYSTQDGTITRTEYGLEIVVDSFSPFTVNWGTEEDMDKLLAAYADTGSLPKTGDESAFALYAALLALSAACFAGIAKKRRTE